MKPSEFDLAYIAGFTDGEGYIGARNTAKTCKIEFVLVNTNKDILEWIQKIIRAGTLSERRKINPRWKTSYELDILAGDVYRVIF